MQLLFRSLLKLKNFNFSYPSLLHRVLQFRCVLPRRFLKLIMNRFAMYFPIIIRVSPLRWQPVFGTGSAILAAFLALAGAASYFDLPDVLCFNLFGALYWVFIYISIYIEIICGVYERTKELIKKTWLFQKRKKAFTQVKENPSLVFFLNIFVISCFYWLIFVSYRILDGQKEAFVKILFIMGECSAIYFCFFSKEELSRFQTVFSFFLSSFLNLLLLEKLAEHVFFGLFFLFFIVEFFLEFFIVKYFHFFPLNFVFLLLLAAYFFSCQEILLWGFTLVVQLVFLYLLRFFFQKEELPSAPPTLFLSLLFLLVSLFFYGNYDYGDPSFRLKILLLGSGALGIHLCFLSTTGSEQVITSLFYISINVLIGGILSDNTTFFFRMLLLYLTVNLFIFVFLWVSSLKTGESLKTIFEKVKVRIVLSQSVFIIFKFAFYNFDSRNNWIWPWLATFASQLVALNLFFFFFDKKEDDLFNALGRKQTTFLSRLVIYSGAVFFVLVYPAAAFILLLNPLFVKHINEGIEEIMADYVHQEMTRNWILVYFRLFLLIVIKDVFLSLVF